MFENQKLLTKGIAENLTASQIARIWQELEARRQKNPKLDYLQVFKNAGLEIWIIDDGSATTMLLPEEY